MNVVICGMHLQSRVEIHDRSIIEAGERIERENAHDALVALLEASHFGSERRELVISLHFAMQLRDTHGLK